MTPSKISPTEITTAATLTAGRPNEKAYWSVVEDYWRGRQSVSQCAGTNKSFILAHSRVRDHFQSVRNDWVVNGLSQQTCFGAIATSFCPTWVVFEMIAASGTSGVSQEVALDAMLDDMWQKVRVMVVKPKAITAVSLGSRGVACVEAMTASQSSRIESTGTASTKITQTFLPSPKQRALYELRRIRQLRTSREVDEAARQLATELVASSKETTADLLESVRPDADSYAFAAMIGSLGEIDLRQAAAGIKPLLEVYRDSESAQLRLSAEDALDMIRFAEDED